MKKQIPYICFILLAGLFACKPDLKAPAPQPGSADFSKYVSIGNSITSGFADAALYYEGQQVAYPNLLAGAFQSVGGGEFKQAYMPAGSPGIGSSLNAKLILGYKTDCKGINSLSPVNSASVGDYNALGTNVSSNGPFNNWGVPGAKAITVVFNGYGNPLLGFGSFNPFFTRMIKSSETMTASMLSKAAEQKATFFSLFIGNNDVLGYAISGGTGDDITPSEGTAGVGFNASIDLIVSTMMSNGAKGVIANIPDVTTIPYFTTIPYNGLMLDATAAEQLSLYYASKGFKFVAGANPFVINDPLKGTRLATSSDLILLSTPQDSIKCAGWGATKPIGDDYVLSADEVSQVRQAVAAFNIKLKGSADANGLAFVDVNAFMASAVKGIAYNGITNTATFVSGGIFSLDGIHLTPRGNALLANKFIEAINLKYGSTIRHLDATQYNGVVFPQQ